MALQLVSQLGVCICSEVIVPNTFWQRAKGLLGRAQLAPEQAFVFYHCNSIHMIGMKFSIDVVYLDTDFRIVKVVPAVKPWSASLCYRARHTLELATGVINAHELKVGDLLYIKEMDLCG